MGDRIRKAVTKLTSRKKKKKAEAAPAKPVAAPKPAAPKAAAATAVLEKPAAPKRITQKKTDPGALATVSLQQAELSSVNRGRLMEAVDMYATSMRSGHPLPLQWLVDTLTSGEVKEVEDYL